ncbi:unnamed protein product [Caenorhabditis nigoni]|uniref:Uncharacterized protein n=1 Tax=Caenorhabditis nigoni TaxID=1611254 RepID=A0A2G5SXM6_9PELO|nr:hypothetical protein B9Z55_025097 [Caenorhabditis nigoni]
MDESGEEGYEPTSFLRGLYRSRCDKAIYAFEKAVETFRDYTIMHSHKFFSIPLTVSRTALALCLKIRDEISKENPDYALLADLTDQLLDYKRHVYDTMGSIAYHCIMENEWGFSRENLILTFEKWTNLLVDPASVSPDDRATVIYSDEDGEFWKIFKIQDIDILSDYSEDVVDYIEDEDNDDSNDVPPMPPTIQYENFQPGSRSASPAFSEDDDSFDKFISFRLGEFKEFDCSF